MNIITGAARSGTTLTAKVFEACGADFGGHTTGLMEDKSFRKITNGCLRSHGYDPLGQGPIPNHSLDCPELKNLPNLEIAKQAKAVFIWKDLHKHHPDAKWVIVRRDKEKIIDSCLRTKFMNRYNTREEWSNWADVYLGLLEEIKEVVDWVEVWPALFKEDTEYEGMKQAVEYLGYEWNTKNARGCIHQCKLL